MTLEELKQRYREAIAAGDIPRACDLFDQINRPAAPPLPNSMIEAWLSGHNAAQHLLHTDDHENNRRIRAAYDALRNSPDPWLCARYDGWFAVMGCEAQ